MKTTPIIESVGIFITMKKKFTHPKQATKKTDIKINYKGKVKEFTQKEFLSKLGF